MYYSAPADWMCTHQLIHWKCKNVTKDTREGSGNQMLYTKCVLLLKHLYCFKRITVSRAVECVKGDTERSSCRTLPALCSQQWWLERKQLNNLTQFLCLTTQSTSKPFLCSLDWWVHGHRKLGKFNGVYQIWVWWRSIRGLSVLQTVTFTSYRLFLTLFMNSWFQVK